MTALTDVEVADLPYSKIEELHRRCPELASLLFWLSGQVDGILSEALVSSGARNAYQKLAHILAEFWHRLDVLGQTDGDKYNVPLTQQHLAEALGLSNVHVSRTLSRLKKDGMISMSKGSLGIELHDRQKLEKLAFFDPSYLRFRGQQYRA